MRKGLGAGQGSGYKNIIPTYDSHVHAMSAKGQASLERYGIRPIPNLGLETIEPREVTEERAKKKKQSRAELMKEVSDKLVSDLKAGLKDVTVVEDVYVNDFGDYMGSIYVSLKSEEYANKYILGDYGNFPDAQKFNIRPIIGAIKRVLNKHEGKDISLRYVQSPKRVYEKPASWANNEFVGYDADIIQIEYEVLG